MAVMKISEAKAAFRQIADRYYRDPLEKAGFVSYKNEGLCWYQIRNDVLFSVLFKLAYPICPYYADFFIFVSILPLFFNPPIPASFLPAHGGIEYRGASRHNQARPLKKRALEDPRVMVPNYPHCGAELLDSYVFPLFRSIRTPKDAFLCFLCAAEEMMMFDAVNMPDTSLERYLTDVLMDEALYFREESVYPAVLVNLRQKENDLLEWNWTLAQEQERAAKLSEVQCRIRAAEFGDFDELQQRFQQREQALMREISQKLPNIQIITDEAALRNAERFPKWISPFPPNMI